ncbi:mechanosensitive ion channel family protein [Pseudomonas neustonica]|uniref:Mechanosensitive ion channel family protein n=2 Tax=Pseudomonas TaxID=286 RepID=A0ABX9XGW5_9PSED|nr:mechanosensitive ion channel protein MscS [Pseudomonadales bacterium]MBA6418761.1 mechanosensitive ion channel family protein [Pseudomonas sp. 5Ae-yellow]ROZ82003.1 mechanosensitive ion channel family protein [Pseudomonas sp. SSM44]ROZ83813.1 mechanosensitive ion channel family protein [Pseudomonas neustonica]
MEQLPLIGEAWMYQVFAVVLCALVAAYVVKLILDRLERRAELTTNMWDDALVYAARRPAWVLIWSMGLMWAARITANEMDEGLADVLDQCQRILLIVLLCWFILRLMKEVEKRLVDTRYRQKPVDKTTVNAVGKLLRASVIITATLVVLQSLGYSVSGVMAFGGIGGIAVGFAAKDLLANFFGGLMVFLDRPFAVGDWVRSPDRDIEGTVEHIGWRLSRIRTFDKRPLYVPNSIFNNIVVENPSRMSHRRIYEHLGIRYADVGQMEPIVQKVRDMLKEHEDIDQEQTQMVFFDRCAPSSVDFFIYCFTTPVWAEYHRVKEDILLKILAIINDHQAQVAFPTSTLHLPDPLALHTERQSAEGASQGSAESSGRSSS